MIYTDLLSCLHSQEYFQNKYLKEAVYDDDDKYINFCEEIAKKWIIDTLPLLSDVSSEKIAAKEDTIYNILRLHDKCSFECGERDDLIYLYFLYFCGILPFLHFCGFCGKPDRHGEEKDEGRRLEEKKIEEYLKKLKSYYESKIDLDRKPLFEFLSLYVDIISLQVSDRPKAFRRLKECLTNDEEEIIFGAIKREHNLMEDVIKATSERNDIRKNLLQNIFPETKDKNIEALNLIKSIMQSKLARLYYVGDKKAKHKDMIAAALDKKSGYPDNSFALVQQAHSMVNEATEYSGEDEEKDHFNNGKIKSRKEKTLLIGTAEKKFVRVIDLLDHDQYKGKLINQEDKVDYERIFGYRIRFEALLGLAYIYYIRGQYSKANKKYNEAEKVVKFFPKGGQQNYLLSVLGINRGRNDLDNGNDQGYKKAMEEFQSVIDKYHDKKYDKKTQSIRQELGELATLAHNNRGVCYLSKGDDEKAKKEFIQALNIDDSSPPCEIQSRNIIL
ncbi:MAG: hypothetical protein WAL24_07910 [Nitrososphaeraceae archaeon]